MRNVVFLILLILFTIPLFVSAQITELPQYEFKSTSTYQYTTIQRQYTVPVAAYELQDPTIRTSGNIRRNGESPGYDPVDPMWTPIGDVMLPLIILSGIYILKKLLFVSILS